MPASSARIGYGAVLGRQGSNLTTIAASTTGSSTPQARTPAAMTSINPGVVLCIDTASATVKEVTKVISDDATTFTSIIENNHSGGISIALMVPVVELTSLGFPQISVPALDATHLLSDDAHMEYIYGIPEGGEIPFEGNCVLDDASQLILVTDMQAQTKKTWSVTLGGTPGNDNQAIWFADCYPIDIRGSLPAAGIIRISGRLKVTGKPQLHF
jgi:hypothetical protein